MILYRLLLIIIIIPSLFAQTQIVIAPGLYQESLLDFLNANYKTTTTLGYTNARDTMYSLIDMHDVNLLSCVYTGFTITLDPALDPSVDAYNQGVNCEHTWPQSMGAGSEPQKSDMHHLFPCKANVNSSRGNDPYGEIPDANTDRWFRLDYDQTTIPAEFIDEFAEKENDGLQIFEPREEHKGDAARAMFYFYTIYNDVADTNFWNVQKDVLLTWHYDDPVDHREYGRTSYIASFQDGIPNPFVLDSTLARRLLYIEEPVTEEPRTWHIAPEGSDETGSGSQLEPFNSIQYGIDIAVDGDTVLVQPGTYVENIVIGEPNMDKTITLISNYFFTKYWSDIYSTVIVGDGVHDVISRDHSSPTTIVGFTIKGGDVGIKSFNYPLRVQNCLIYNNNIGIELGDCDKTEIISCTVTNNYEKGIIVNAGGALYAFPFIINSIISGNGTMEFTIGAYTTNMGFLVGPHLAFDNVFPFTFDLTPEDTAYANVLFHGGIIQENSLFSNEENDNYSLLSQSPCIDAGTALFIFDNDTIVNFSEDEYFGLAPDIGAYEYGGPVSADKLISIPDGYTFHQNYPNPFNPTTTISYSLPEQSLVKLTVFDIRGQEVMMLQDSEKPPGNYEVQWNGLDQQGNQVSTGVYFARLQAGDYSQTIKMVFLR